MKAVGITAESLLEMKKTSFKQWFELLLEQHDALHDELKQILYSDNNVQTRIDMNVLTGFYYTISKNPVSIKYANLVISILNYVDKEFYLDERSVDARLQFVEQLSNRMDSRVKLAIAVLGLGVDENKTFNRKKLYGLLTKYDFFSNELFFDSTFKNINTLDSYLTTTFNTEFRSSIQSWVDRSILNRSQGITNPYEKGYCRFDRLSFTVYWAYKNICGTAYKKMFEELPMELCKAIAYQIEIADKSMRKAIESSSNLIGCVITGPDSKNITIRNERHLVRLTEFYIKNKNRFNNDIICISNSHQKIYLSQMISKIEQYELGKSYFELGKESDCKETIDKITTIIEEIIKLFEAKLNKAAGIT